MNTELLKTVRSQLHQVIGMLALEDREQAKNQLIMMVRGLGLIIAAQEKYPMTLTELETEFKIRKKEIHNEAT